MAAPAIFADDVHVFANVPDTLLASHVQRRTRICLLGQHVHIVLLDERGSNIALFGGVVPVANILDVDVDLFAQQRCRVLHA